MSQEELPPISLRPFRTAAVRRAVLAPELERFLSRRHVDLMVTDQIEALQVRVRRGIEVVDQRLLKGLRAARRRAMTLLATAAAGFALALVHIFASTHGIFRSGGFPARVLWLLAGLAFVAALAALPLSIAAFFDARQLSRLQGRYAGGVDRARSVEELLGFAEKVLAEARRMGMAP